MSFFNNIKTMLGFPDEEDNTATMEKESIHNTPYINPFKKEAEQPTAMPKAETKSKATDINDNVSREIIEKVATVLNNTLPEYAKQCIDKEAQENYVKSLIGETISNFITNASTSATETARLEWQEERMIMEQKAAAAAKQLSDTTAKNDELRNRMMSIDRQKIALNERISALESKAATAEAEREQYELQCKSLMNKLKVASLNDDTINALKQENDDLLSANEQLKKEMTELTAVAEKSMNEKNEELASAIEALTAKTSDLSEEISRLKLDNETITAEKEALVLKAADAERLAEEVAKLKEAATTSAEDLQEATKAHALLAAKEREMADMRATIQSQNDEIYALHERIGELSTAQPETEAIKELTDKCNSLSEEMATLTEQLASKDAELKDATNKTTEVTAIYEQLKKEFERTKKHFADNEISLREENDKLRKEVDKLNNDILNQSAVSEVKSSQKQKKQDKEKAKSVISAIDYSTEYSDWLMPTPPSSSIPIVDDEPEEPQPSKPEKSKHNHNIPEQMELF